MLVCNQNIHFTRLWQYQGIFLYQGTLKSKGIVVNTVKNTGAHLSFKVAQGCCVVAIVLCKASRSKTTAG